MRVAFIGLGVMGAPMAGHLCKQGHEVSVFNRSEAKAQDWVKVYGGKVAASPYEAAQGVEQVFLCVGNDDDVRSVLLGDRGCVAALSRGTVVVDHSTTSATLAQEMAAVLAKKGFDFLDAPVSGGQAGAQKGVLTVMVGGEQAALDRAAPQIAAYSQKVARIGPSGSGQLAKMVNQICIAGLLQGLAEGVQFGLDAGLDMKLVLEVISRGAAASWQMENRGPTMIEGKFDFGFAVDWMRKDLGLCLEEARHNGASLPVAALVDQFYARLQAGGDRRSDTSSLIKLLKNTPTQK